MGVVYKSPHSYCGATATLRKLANGDLLTVFREAMWRGFASHIDPTARATMVRSTDGGETWHSPVTPDAAGANGVAFNQLSDGTLLLHDFHWIYAPLSRKDELKDFPSYQTRTAEQFGLVTAIDGMHVTRSTTDGYTWECPRPMDMPGFNSGSSVGGVIELDDGTVLMPVDGHRDGDSRERSWIMSSTDGGLTWGYQGAVAVEDDSAIYQELRLALLPGGRVLGTMRTPGSNFFLSHSDDGGKTWSTPEETPIWCYGSSPMDVIVLGDGRVLATYARRAEPFGIRACVSEDGITWDTAGEIVLRDDGLDRDMGYPSSQQLDDGSILTVYYWHGDDQIRYIECTKWTVDR